MKPFKFFVLGELIMCVSCALHLISSHITPFGQELEENPERFIFRSFGRQGREEIPAPE